MRTSQKDQIQCAGVSQEEEQDARRPLLAIAQQGVGIKIMLQTVLVNRRKANLSLAKAVIVVVGMGEAVGGTKKHRPPHRMVPEQLVATPPRSRLNLRRSRCPLSLKGATLFNLFSAS